jgi:drug/metabolite transporter (DMT)-like permease
MTPKRKLPRLIAATGRDLAANIRRQKVRLQRVLARIRPAYLNIAGLVMSLVGVILLFRFGLPFALPMNGEVMLVTENVNQTLIEHQHRYEILGYTGLILIIVGTACQACASYLQR